MPRRVWPPTEIEYLRDRYPHVKGSLIAATLGVSLDDVYRMAKKLGLGKSDEFFAGPDSGRTTGIRGKSQRFPKGSVPWNKGMKGLQMGGVETQFKPGSKPGNWLPVGSHRYSKEGYLQRKVTDTGYPPRDWVGVHILLWTEANGPVPDGHAVSFKDGDKEHVLIENLELISRRDLMARNSVHNLPEELKGVIRIKAALTRKINEHD
jgi:hypothetical protein